MYIVVYVLYVLGVLDALRDTWCVCDEPVMLVIVVEVGSGMWEGIPGMQQ